jgi:hypothetical protein
VGDYVCYGVALPPLLPPEYEGAAAAATKTPTISQTPLGPYPIIPSPMGSQGSVKAAHAKKVFPYMTLYCTCVGRRSKIETKWRVENFEIIAF